MLCFAGCLYKWGGNGRFIHRYPYVSNEHLDTIRCFTTMSYLYEFEVLYSALLFTRNKGRKSQSIKKDVNIREKCITLLRKVYHIARNKNIPRAFVGRKKFWLLNVAVRKPHWFMWYHWLFFGIISFYLLKATPKSTRVINWVTYLNVFSSM